MIQVLKIIMKSAFNGFSALKDPFDSGLQYDQVSPLIIPEHHGRKLTGKNGLDGWVKAMRVSSRRIRLDNQRRKESQS